MLKRLLLVGILVFHTGLYAEVRIGHVDFERISKEYYKAKEAVASLEMERKKSEEALKLEWQGYQKMIEEAEGLEKKFNDPALKPDASRKLREQASDLLKRAKIERDRLNKIKMEKEAPFMKRYSEATQQILGDVSKVAKALAEEKGLTLILDNKGKTDHASPCLQFTIPEMDLTEEFLTRLNAGAPKKQP